MKKLMCFILAVVTLLSLFAFVSYGVVSSYDGVTEAKTVTDSAVLLYSKKFGVNYKNSPTVPVVVDDTLIVASGRKLYKLRAKNGEVLAEADMAESNMYSVAPPLYADGKIFVQLDSGVIQAFSYDTMESLWVYKDKLKGQSLTPITYSYGYIYTGFWNGEDEKANYVSLSVKDENPKEKTEEKEPRWVYTAKGGFYAAGCAVTEKFVLFGKDNGERQSLGKSKIISLNKTNGRLADTLSVKGDIRSGVVYSKEEKAFYTASKSGYVYKFRMNSETGKLKSLGTYTANGSITATPVIYNGRLYVGAQKGAKGELLVLDAGTMKKIYSAETDGYPQASVLLSAGYEAETKKVYIYLTCNSKPGGITVFEDSQTQKTAVKRTLFMPDEENGEYCISTITSDREGNLYYKNDSGNIFAVGHKRENKSFFETLLRLILSVISQIFGR